MGPNFGLKNGSFRSPQWDPLGPHIDPNWMSDVGPKTVSFLGTSSESLEGENLLVFATLEQSQASPKRFHFELPIGHHFGYKEFNFVA